MRWRVFAALGLLFCCAGWTGSLSISAEENDMSAPIKDAFQGVLPVTEPAMKRSLNGLWRLKVVEGIDENQISVPDIDDSWGTIPVPGCWETYGFCKPKYDSPDSLTGYYRTSFSVPEEWRGKRIILRFDGVLYGYDLWVNGKHAGTWRSAYNTALFDITDFLNNNSVRDKKSGWGIQQLALRVISKYRGSDFDCNDDWAPNGIFRDVTLMAVPLTHLADLTVTTKMNGEVAISAQVANASKQTSVEAEITGTGSWTFEAQKFKKSSLSSYRVNVFIPHPQLWTAETPYLYTLYVHLKEKGKVIQTYKQKVGIRQLSIDGNVLKLNGQPFKLRGVTSHSTDPKTVKVIDEASILKDMNLMKEASVNYIRTSHYPREPRFYELADSLGFYIIDEVPFGFGDKHLSDSTFYPVLQQRAQATIRRDKNHASVLIWSLGNENPLTDICIRLGDYVKRALDSSRPVCYPQVGSYFRRFNYEFPKVADIYAPHYPTTDQIADFYQKADRPVIFTEYCHTLGISFEDHDHQWDIIERTPCIAGGSVWEWVDQGMPLRKKVRDSEGNNLYGYEERVLTREGGFEMFGNKGTDGLLYADRTPLPNYYELQHNYARAFVSSAEYIDGAAVLAIHNRYDFMNLKDKVSFRWVVSEDCDTMACGAFSPSCVPHDSVLYSLDLPVTLCPERICMLHMEMVDAQGHVFNHQTFPLVKHDLMGRILSQLNEQTANPMTLVQDGVLIRVGRKATLAEKIKVGDKRLERYLLHYSSEGKSAGSATVDIQTKPVGNATHISFSLTPDSTDTFLSELGIAFLLDKKIDRVQWWGNGLMPTYPGRYRAGQYGLWALQQGDLYFEGNRMGVDAALLTDSTGEGLLMLCSKGNVSFEQTDRGIVLTYNAAVSGQGPKFRRTIFPVIAKEAGTVNGDFYLYRVEMEKVPQILHDLFYRPADIPAPFRPFETQYDTYLMRYEDIIGE